MSTLPTIDSGTLGWVKSEIEDTAAQARSLLDQFDSDASDRSLMRMCSTHLHQIYGTLTMVELDGAARLISESEQLTQKIAEGKIEWQAQTGSTLRRSLDDLTSYLEGLQSPPVPSPLQLIESINRVRATREAEAISELELFAPDLSARPPDPTSQVKFESSLFLELANDLRIHFERALLTLLRNSEDRDAINEISRVLKHLLSIDRRASLRQLWWIASGISEVLLDGSVVMNDEIRQIFAQVNEQLKRLQEKSQSSRRRAPPDDLIKRALLVLARSGGTGPTVSSIRERFGLDDWIRKESSGAMPDINQLSSGLTIFSSESEVDLRQAQSLLARYFSPQGGNTQTLERLATRLQSLKQAAERNNINIMARLLNALLTIVDGLGNKKIDDLDAASMQIASSLLFIEDSTTGVRPGVEWHAQAEATISSLKSLGTNTDDLSVKDSGVHEVAVGTATPARGMGDDKVIRAAASEVSGELQYVEHTLEKVATGEVPSANLKSVEPHLKRIEGTLEILEHADVAALAEQLRLSLHQLVEDDAVDTRGLDALAMAVGTISLCAEQIGKGSNLNDLASTITRAKTELQSLGGTQAAGLGEDRSSVHLDLVRGSANKSNNRSDDLALDFDDGLELDTDPLVTANLPLADVVDDQEDELVTVFFEEAREIDEEITSAKHRWQEEPDNFETLKALRRGFHTLKGGGRFIGAGSIAELSFVAEDLLNSVLEGDVIPSSGIHSFVDKVHQRLTQLIHARDIGSDLDLTPWQARAGALKNASVESADIDTDSALDINLSEPRTMRPAVGIADTRQASDTTEVDSVFRDELDGHIQVIVDSVADARQSFPNWQPPDVLLRTAHTLRGVFRSVGLNACARMADSLDDLLNFQRKSTLSIQEVDLVLLDQSGRLIRFATGKLGAELKLGAEVGLQFDELAGALTQRLRFLEAAAPTTVSMAQPPPVPADVAHGTATSQVVSLTLKDDDADIDLVDAFREEAQEILERFGQSLDQWREGSALTVILPAMRRELHTFKGGARTVGWTALGDLAHNTETLLEFDQDVKSGPDRVFTLVQDVYDLAASVIASNEEVLRNDIERLNHNILDFDVSASPAIETVDEDDARRQHDELLNVALDAATVAGKSLDEKLPTSPAVLLESDARVVRVNTELLDELVNHAGEVSILRSRLQQQISTVKSNLGELGMTVRRFREQLRDLEIESEAQMLASNERLREDGASAFDPLELDRFSRLQTVSRQLGESLGELASIQAGISEFAGDAENTLQQQAHLSESLQDGLLRTRMVPFASIVPRLRRLTRQTGRELGSAINLEVRGENVEVDRKVLEQMSAPFEHMIRNAISHGIEEASVRTAASKPEIGTIVMSLGQDGNDIVIEISDDGRGLDLKAIEDKARNLGLLKPDQPLGEDDLMRVLSAPGLSTASSLTRVSGRGIGMDVVSDMIRQLGGSINVESKTGKGVTFTLRLPVTLAVSHALLVYAGEQMFAVPARLIVNVLRIPADDIEASDAEADGYTYYNDRRIPVLNLAHRLGLPFRGSDRNIAQVIVVRSARGEIGLWVESISDTREVVVKPLGKMLQSISGIGAVTLLGDGSIVLILDIPGLWQKRTLSVTADSYATAPRQSDNLTVMVVDDSMTVRNVMGRDLQNSGYEVILAKDGVDAIEQLRHTVPDILLVDLEMPRMDGFELTRRVRADNQLGTVPILIITSRAGTRHRDQAMGLGANGYMSKPYRLDELVKSINSLTNNPTQMPLETVH